MLRWLMVAPSLFLVDASLSGCTLNCPAKGCTSGALITVEQVHVADLAGGELRICRNETCDVVALDGSGIATHVENKLGSHVGPHTPGVPVDVLQIIVPPHRDSFAGSTRPGDLVDGDVYLVEARSADDVVLATATWDAVYVDTYAHANSAECGDAACQAARLDGSNVR